MNLSKILLPVIAFGGGVAVGSAAAAFITILLILPRLAQVTDTREYIKIYQSTIVFSFIVSMFIYFTDIHMTLPKYFMILIGLIYGTFVGLLSSALAEVLNVIPVLSKKIKIKDSLKYVIWALMAGKVAGSLFYWIYLNQGR